MIDGDRVADSVKRLALSFRGGEEGGLKILKTDVRKKGLGEQRKLTGNKG